ncbi:protocatechuate 4,5-dioxygenase beta chain/2'-carboxy-2,3-dihydroxybiphenyl 1,2-dioxygenase large subunit/2'-aminobiphenyl-2,3-diol 1,2-dioxygenase large subunit [Nocardioides massiliensis]|uniref:Protocatechuate 4,5-dioxygenase beta chain/2'-carboxy-2,3-dihydroxybiphenyl 1,2-dioxygenase large subunit/2'-aminobiphenyl-2,3-diol 1,2-dioxygenase large subunit n=1 Tax=Nocardioides massiliensis TaxID=1325935 RepID=A0ABT9NTK0_9ACTN|nr:protocatechuate 4,5-dioxygenase beta chain/2'-carboxy-2,3-dihydroxybiphenyl 1,2-dioxygenase large subunit/2'-aminobiphenyl-2,3-diol 1,2-dioxygenase large subunit [Nocardioides massiliensis]
MEKLSPDLLVVVGSEHLKSFGYDAFPQICIGIGDTCEGWADGGLAAARLDLAGDYAGQLLSAGIDAGFDLAFSVNPRLDHGFMAPLVLIRPEMDIPVVPIFQNASTEPLPPLRRSAELGRLIRAVTEQRPDEERVVIIGTGGLSHWVGTPQMGQVNSEFDELFLARVRDGDLEGVVDMTMSDVVAQGGNGAPEIRNWVTVMSARQGKGTVLAYEAVREWATGIALARLFPEGVDEPAT